LLPALDAAAAGARVAIENARQAGSVDSDALDRWLIEMEAVGQPVPADLPNDWSEGDWIETLIEPGVHGVALEYGGQQKLLCPTEIFTTDHLMHDALLSLGEQLGLSASQLAQASISRFRTTHWVELRPGGEVVQLQCGLIVIPPRAVTERALNAAIERLAEYMMYRQRADGAFSYQYEPARDQYSEEDNAVRQAGAAWALSYYARRSRSAAALASADLAIRNHLERLTELTDIDGAAFIRTPDNDNELGVTALTCLALLDHPQRERFTTDINRLLTGILWLQRPDGRFITAFPPAHQLPSQNYFPGEALCALARAYRADPQERYMQAFGRALDFYRNYFEKQRVPAFVPWQVQAFSEMALQSKREDFARFVLEMSDWLAGTQLNEHNCPWPEMWGGFAPYTTGRAGVSTASYLEGFVDALRLARQRGDAERARRYEQAIAAAVRFVIQLQVRPEEAYFIRSPQDAVGGIRTTPSHNHLRIDHCQHALMALCKARDVLFSD
jgi:hypothetical protein